MQPASNPQSPLAESTRDWSHLDDLGCDLTVDVPLPEFRVADWLALCPRSVIDTRWRVGTDVPLRVNGELLGWCEFEIVENRLAIRLTELA